LVALALIGCSASAHGDGSSDSASVGPTMSGMPSASTLAGDPSDGPDPIPDATLPSPRSAGEPVEVRGATIQYEGLAVEGQQLVARFSLLDGAVGDPLRLAFPDGTTVDLHVDGSELVSDPFGTADVQPSSRSTMTLLVGSSLVHFLVGPVN
jgi:hypothetical protein